MYIRMYIIEPDVQDYNPPTPVPRQPTPLSPAAQCDIGALTIRFAEEHMSQPTDYKPGHMDVASQRDMYHLFNILVRWGGLAVATLLIFLVLLLCAHAGFLPSLIVAVVVAGAGALWLSRPKAH
jgi:hypothetical protein